MTPALAARRTTLSFVAVGGVAAILVAVVAALVGLGIVWSILLALVVGAALAWWLYAGMDAAILRGVGARPLAAGEQARFANVVEGLCVANGFREPALHLIDDAAPNLLMVGRDPKHGALAVTTGLLDRLDRVELEGAGAHELLRTRLRTTSAQGAAAVLVRSFGFVPGVAATLRDRLVDSRSSVELDVGGVELTRYPPGLAGALDAIRRDGRQPTLAPAWSGHMWLAPIDGTLTDEAFTVADRIAVLEEL